MSIAALLQAAEYIERRERGELNFLFLSSSPFSDFAWNKVLRAVIDYK